jgi:hypothetical protein
MLTLLHFTILNMMYSLRMKGVMKINFSCFLKCKSHFIFLPPFPIQDAYWQINIIGGLNINYTDLSKFGPYQLAATQISSLMEFIYLDHIQTLKTCHKVSSYLSQIKQTNNPALKSEWLYNKIVSITNILNAH